MTGGPRLAPLLLLAGACTCASSRPATAFAPVRGAPISEPGCAPEPDRAALAAVLDRADAARRRGDTPIAVFDLDGTLTDPDARTLAILSDALSGATGADAEEARRRIQALHRASVPPRLPYDVRDVLASLGVSGPLAERLRTSWLDAFFTGAALAHDATIPGAPKFVRRLQGRGTRIVYLTARCGGTTEAGTISSLRSLGFPLGPAAGDVPTAELTMKPGHTQAECKGVADRAFKASVLDAIAPAGAVVGVFENEPANLADLAARFGRAVPVFVASSHSPGAPPLPRGARCVLDYRDR